MSTNLTGPSLPPLCGGAPSQIVILLHGYVSSGSDLISFAPHWQRGAPEALFLAPNAPHGCPGMDRVYQWWDLSANTPQALAEGAVRAAPALNSYIEERLDEYGLDETRLALVGFSQGAMLALHLGPRRERQIAGIIGYSGALTGAAALAREAVSKPPVLLVHGSADPIVPAAEMRAAKASLQGLGFDVESHVYRGLGHTLNAKAVRLGGKFLRRVLGGRDGGKKVIS